MPRHSKCCRGDTTRSDALLRRFPERVMKLQWPGSRAPLIYYDSENADIGSANFTQAAQLRNIELGVVVSSLDAATAAELHIGAIIARGIGRSERI